MSVPANSPKPAAATDKPDKIPLEIEPGADPNVVWDQYFSTHRPTLSAVRDAVRRLRHHRKLEQAARFDHIIALIKASLRYGEAQPWMYEVMAVVMQAQGRSDEEIGRVVMSAVDFMGSSADLMHIGVYLTRL
ncbi:MAG: hypothetical protein GY773_11260, partial [Actinomycetia bacterium]|nr:hypothetical protein [Actinomycetes bacterium]